MAKTPLAYDSTKLKEQFVALRNSPRMPRVLDVLVLEKEGVLDLLRDGRGDAKAIWTAFARAGLSVSYSAFQRAMKTFVVMQGLQPPGRRGPAAVSRFLPTRGNSQEPTVRSVGTEKTGGNAVAERRRQLAAPSASELEQNRIATATRAAS